MSDLPFKTLTVGQLRAALEGFAPETPVAFAAPAHDLWGTVLACGIRDVDLSPVTYSTYHQSFKVQAEAPDGDTLEVLLLE